MNDLTIFNSSEFGEIRTVTIDGKPYFVAVDVAAALGYATPRDAISRHCKGVVKRDTPTSSGIQQMSYINEGDLYRLIMKSKLPSAEKFESWVVDEVLPAIRKTGSYQIKTPQGKELLALAVLEAQKTIEAQTAEIERMKPKEIFADAVAASHTSILIGDLAKLLRQNGVETGQRRLFDWLRENGYLIKRKGCDWNMPTQRSMEHGLFEVKESTVNNPDGSVRINRTTKVTGKGQQYFINKFVGNSTCVALR
ncbi:phage antirepressor [Eubacterium ramulus]